MAKKLLTARDGTTLDPISCRRAGGYWVGPKGNEHKFLRHQDAIAAASLMDNPSWRRPNANGNWGIVSAVK
jgi:hypothetical protein